MDAKAHHDEKHWKEVFDSFDTNRDGVVSVHEFIEAVNDKNINSCLPKRVRVAITKKEECINFEDFLMEIRAYEEQNLFMYILNKWIHFIVPPKQPHLKPGVYKHLDVPNISQLKN